MNGMAPLCACGCGLTCSDNKRTGRYNKYASRKCRERSADRSRKIKIKTAYGISSETYHRRRLNGTLPPLIGPAYTPKPRKSKAAKS